MASNRKTYFQAISQYFVVSEWKRQVVIEQTRFLSTVFLCSEFTLENTYSSVNFCGKNVCGNFYLRELIFADRKTNRNATWYMKSWLTQGSSDRRVALPPKTTFLQYQWVYSLPRSRFLGCHVTLRGTLRDIPKTAERETTGLKWFFFRRLSGCLSSPLPRYRVVNVSPLLLYALSNNPRIVLCTQPEDTHVNKIISLIMHCTEYLLPVFLGAKILQLIVEISTSCRFLK